MPILSLWKTEELPNSYIVGYNPIVDTSSVSSIFSADIEELTDEAQSSSLNQASFFSCYVCLANTLLGAGMLGLPYAFSHTGWVLGSLLICLCGCCSMFALHCLSICARRTEKPSSFYAVAMLAAPKYVFLIDLAVAIKCFGVATSYLIILGGLMPEAMEQMGASDVWRNRQLWVCISAIIVVPLSCLHSLENLKFASTFSLVFVFILALIIVLFAVSAFGLDPCDGSSSSADECVGPQQYWAADGISVMRVLSIFVFAFTCHQVCLVALSCGSSFLNIICAEYISRCE